MRLLRHLTVTGSPNLLFSRMAKTKWDSSRHRSVGENEITFVVLPTSPKRRGRSLGRGRPPVWRASGRADVHTQRRSLTLHAGTTVDREAEASKAYHGGMRHAHRGWDWRRESASRREDADASGKRLEARPHRGGHRSEIRLGSGNAWQLLFLCGASRR